MELVNNDSRLLLVATSHRNITSISNTLVYMLKNHCNSTEYACKDSSFISYFDIPHGNVMGSYYVLLGLKIRDIISSILIITTSIIT